MAKRVQSNPLNLIILGYPTAGKGTQARMLTKKYHLFHFSSGAGLRKMATKKTLEGRKVKEILAKGGLMPSKYTEKMMKEVIMDTPASKGIAFDGNPRKMGEAKLYTKWLSEAGRNNPLVIFLTIPGAEMYKRTLARSRDEDNILALKRRIAWSKAEVVESFNYLKTKYPSKKINGLGTRDQVHKRIVKEISAYLKKI